MDWIIVTHHLDQHVTVLPRQAGPELPARTRFLKRRQLGVALGLLLGGSGCIGGSKGPSAASSSEAAAEAAPSAPDPNFLIFLLLGQSNMEGAPAPEAEDRIGHPRVKVLAYDNCDALDRSYNHWYPATPPLHSCGGGVGPGDWFGKAMADALPKATIGLVPNAINGVDVDFFRKGVVSARRGEFKIAPDNHWSSAYDAVIERARLAQRFGVIRGILFHQGESDSGNPAWVGKVQELVANLRADLQIEDVPFLAGELLHSGRCAGHNSLVNELPNHVPNSFVVATSGLAGMDEYHFDLAGQRALGRRYAETLLARFVR